MTKDNTARIETNNFTPVACRPFVKWVGGKSQLLPSLLNRIPARFNRYFEPFVGGGALFFALQPQQAFLSDINNDLINAYKVVQTQVAPLIRDLKKHKYESDYYYSIRNVDRLPIFQRWSPVRRASRLIFLNKTCFNGLYRVNSRGLFNTPFGRYTNPTIVDEENLRACSAALQTASLRTGPFDEVKKMAKKNDFVYFDPPYVPLSVTSYFTSYSAAGFDLAMQRLLFETCCALDRQGVKFMLSNSSAPFVLDLYKPFKVELIAASRAINSVGSKRGKVQEVIVTNY